MLMWYITIYLAFCNNTDDGTFFNPVVLLKHMNSTLFSVVT